MSDVLSGLESMGLGNLSNIELFNDKKQKADEEKKKAEKAKEVKELEEKDLIYLKNVECPCCGKEFKERAIRPGKARMISQDTDLRPRYKELDTMKYNVTACPVCGYAALTRDFTHLSSGQARLVKEKISMNFTGLKYDGDTYSYVISNVTVGTYTVSESSDGSNSAYSCSVAPAGSSITMGISATETMTYSFDNYYTAITPNTGSVEFCKVDPNGNPINNCTFELTSSDVSDLVLDQGMIHYYNL